MKSQLYIFGGMVCVSLLSPCVLRLRRKVGARKWERANVRAEPRSAYLLSGASREEWEHSIPPVEALPGSRLPRSIAMSRCGGAPNSLL